MSIVQPQKQDSYYFVVGKRCTTTPCTTASSRPGVYGRAVVAPRKALSGGSNKRLCDAVVFRGMGYFVRTSAMGRTVSVDMADGRASHIICTTYADKLHVQYLVHFDGCVSYS